jgi:spoIIIJ-associated protein
VPEDSLSLAEQGEIAEQFVVGLLERFGTAAQTSLVTTAEDTVEVQVAGPELGLLIGPKGQTLQALQELTRTVVQRRSVARTGRIVVDVAGYRQKRKQALERFTLQVAQDVIAAGSPRALEPMNAADRKVVHDTANEISGVKTISEGEEPRRRVVILPEAGGASSGDEPEAVAADATGAARSDATDD